MALLQTVYDSPLFYKGFGVGVLLLFLYLGKYPYRVWFHPLSRFPGPPVARASSVWLTSAARKLRKAQAVHAAHEIYGPIVRIAPNELSFSDPEALQSLYGHGRRLPKSDFYAGGKFTNHENIFSMRGVAQHAGRRSVMAPVFSSKFVSTFVNLIQQKIDQTLDNVSSLSANGKRTADLYHWLHTMSLDIVFHFTLNQESGSLITGNPHPVIRDLEDFQSVFAWTALFPPLRQFGRFIPIWAVKKPFVSLHNWVQFCLEITGRERFNDKKASFIYRLLENPDTWLQRQLDDIEVAEELIGIMFAGSGTVANTISFLLWAVLENNQVREKLVAELDQELPDGVTNFPMEVVNRLPYLNAVIMETLRRYPVVPGLQPRVVVGDDLVIAGEKIPAGTTVGCQNFTIHMNPTVFPSPELFIPERWLAEVTSAQKTAFNGFGTGPRACMGRNLAMAELQLFVAAFFKRFNATISEALTPDDMVMTDGFTGGPVSQTLPMYLVERHGGASTNTEKIPEM